MKKKKYYAYYILETEHKGVVDSWELCKLLVSGQKSRYKSFVDKETAEKWLENPEYSNKPKNPKLSHGLYFDSGTGGGLGLQVRVTDKDGISLIHEIVPEEHINKQDNYSVKDGQTNNYGELLGLYIALKLALKSDELVYKKIFGDSKLVIEHWGKGHIKNTVKLETRKLSKKVAELRLEYERRGGLIEHVSGDINPSDLGFHKI